MKRRHLNDLRDVCHAIARGKGFWDVSTEFGTKIALIHSELSEALEAAREGRFDENDKAGVPVELADVLIRVLDLCGGMGIDIQTVVERKIEINRARPALHGKKF